MKQSFDKVGIVLSGSGKLEVETCRQNLLDWLRKRNVQLIEEAKVGTEKVIGESDLIICLGGDGTILRLAGKMIDRTVPVLGVNLGNLGFLTEVKTDEVFDELKTIFLGQYEIENRLMLSCIARNEKGAVARRFQALNDVIVNREGLTRYMQVELKLSSEPVTRYFGDGIIISTPTGSTAYSLSAGGPIVHPGLNDMIITPICAHAPAMRPIIVSADKKIEIRITCDTEKEKALLTADGQDNLEIDSRSTVEVSMATNRFPLIKSSKRGYFETLREKFKIPY